MDSNFRFPDAPSGRSAEARTFSSDRSSPHWPGGTGISNLRPLAGWISALERGRFQGHKQKRKLKSVAPFARNRKFESISLQQTVRFSPEFASAREKAAVFRGCAGGRGWCGRERRATPGHHQVNRRYYLWRAIFQYRNAARCGSQQGRHWPACEVGLPGGVAVSASF